LVERLFRQKLVAPSIWENNLESRIMKVVNSVQNELEVALSSWIVQDGNYDNFEANQHAEFALEFYSKSFRKSDVTTKSAKSLGAAKYEILG